MRITKYFLRGCSHTHRDEGVVHKSSFLKIMHLFLTKPFRSTTSSFLLNHERNHERNQFLGKKNTWL